MSSSGRRAAGANCFSSSTVTSTVLKVQYYSTYLPRVHPPVSRFGVFTWVPTTKYSVSTHYRSPTSTGTCTRIRSITEYGPCTRRVYKFI